MAYITTNKIKNASGTTINPSTEDTLAQIQADIAIIKANQTDGSQFVQIRDAGGDIAKVDPYGVLEVIDYAHHEIHGGNFWTFTYADNTSASTVRDILIVMGANEMHALFSVVAEVRCFLSIYEGTVTSANGTLLTSASNNRVVLGDPRTTVLYSGPTVTSVGTLLSYELRTATGLNDNRSEGEWILAPNTKYLFRIAPSANTRVGFKMQGYEE